MYAWLMRLLFRRVDAELAHTTGLLLLRLLGAAAPLRELVARRNAPPAAAATRALGLSLRSPVGLAAGYDKNARAVLGLWALGFGFVEIGTVTAIAQGGNDKPRLFRLTEDHALINRMGFNNDGAVVVAARLAALRATPAGRAVVLGVNVGRSKVAAPDQTVDDYRTSAGLLAPYADYLVINISSPNTPGLRDLHDPVLLRPLLVAVQEACAAARPDRPVLPLLVKLSPDSPDDALLEIADLAVDVGLAGIIVTNTTVARDGLRTPAAQVESYGAGGLSGPPLRERAVAVQQLLTARLAGTGLAVVASGGVETAADVAARLAAGATLVEAYTGVVYGGPGWVRRANAAV